jgi:hypothetical protein
VRSLRRAVVHVALLALLKSPDADGLERSAGRQISIGRRCVRTLMLWLLGNKAALRSATVTTTEPTPRRLAVRSVATPAEPEIEGADLCDPTSTPASLYFSGIFGVKIDRAGGSSDLPGCA